MRLLAKAIRTIKEIWFSVLDGHLTRNAFGLCQAHARLEMRNKAYPLGGNILDVYIYSIAGGRWREIIGLPWPPTL